MTQISFGKRRAAWMATMAFSLILAACGGGGGNPGTPVGVGSGGTGGTGGTTAAPKLDVAFTNASGQTSNTLSGTSQLTAKATVLDKAGKPVPNAIVTFSTDNTLALFTPGNGTALTDTNGVATVAMRVASLSAGGAGTVTATTTVAGAAVSGSGNYSVGATTLTFGTLTANPTSIAAYGSTVLSVDVLAGSAKYTDQAVNVNFSSPCVAAGKATLAAVVATNNGTAQTVYRDQGCGNNDTVTVSTAAISKPATAQLVIAAPAAASVQFAQATPTDKSIVIKGQGGSGRTETASLKFKVVDIFNNPLAGAAVDFTASTTAVTINKVSDTTDQNGEVITTVNSGAIPTSFRVKAALHSNASVFTWSDSIVVSTGLPVQRAFSLSAGKYQLDTTIESNPTKPATNINVMIADANGNPVPDGTPVVFQTNMGSIGSADKGGCITTNGGCSVDFRMQDPRVATPGQPATPCNAATPDNTRRGVATVCASTTDGTNTVFGKLELYFVGNSVGHAYLNGDPAQDMLPGQTNDLGSAPSAKPFVFSLLLTDSDKNPLPTGTTISVINLSNATAPAPTPATVSNIVPVSNTTAPQGSTHSFTINSTQATSCTAPANAAFTVAVTTPDGEASYIPFKLTFTCP